MVAEANEQSAVSRRAFLVGMVATGVALALIRRCCRMKDPCRSARGTYLILERPLNYTLLIN